MKKYLALAVVVLLLTMLALAACNNDTMKLKENEVYFAEDQVVTSYFDGLGVEWGVYEDTNKLVSGAFDKMYSYADRLNPRLVRCMLNFDWVVYDFDNNGTEDDPTDDTWKYNFDNKYMRNACDILDYCQEHGIKVALGVWNVIGSVKEEEDVWKMIPNATADIRWAQLSADLMDYLVNVKGYTCIKWFVSSNEPNYTGAVGSSKNAYNTYQKWETGVKNVRAAFDAIGLTNLDIVGGDTTGFNGSAEYLPGIAKGLTDVVSNYGIHMYISNYDIDTGLYGQNLSLLYNEVKKLDDTLGDTKPMYIWEAGLLDGKNVTTDCNAYIANFSYGIRMADYTVQSILAGINGIAYWDFDDAMHFMYTENGSTAKEWGMFSSLASATAFKQELRPWYHSSVLLTNLLGEGNKIYAGTQIDADDTFRTIATVSADGTRGGFVAINRGTQDVTKSFCLQPQVASGGKLYVYLFNEQNMRLDANGFVTYNYQIDGSLNNVTTITIPANCVAVVSSELL